MDCLFLARGKEERGSEIVNDVPLSHTPDGQRVPQDPQFWGSVRVSVQLGVGGADEVVEELVLVLGGGGLELELEVLEIEL